MSQIVQSVNLYLPEFRKKKYWLDAEKMLLLTAASLILLVFASIYEGWLLYELHAQVADKEQQRLDIAAATEALKAQYGVQTEDPALLASIQALEQDLQSKQALLQFLEGRDLGNTEGFSEHLADLARYHMPGLSLTAVRLTNGGRSVILEGQVLRAELVPQYLLNLSKGKTYAGKNFEALKIEGAGSGILDSLLGNNAMQIWDFQVKSVDQ